jgi:hypothetical protein
MPSRPFFSVSRPKVPSQEPLGLNSRQRDNHPMRQLVVMAMVLDLACGGCGSGNKIPTGDESGGCYPNNTCNGDLSCTCPGWVSCTGSGRCVDVGILNPKSNASCGSSADCNGALCAAISLAGSPKVCIPGVSMCEARGLPGACLLEVVAVCQYSHDCSASGEPDFNKCVACRRPRESA